VIRSAVSKVMWVGKATVFLVSLAVILAMVLGVASMAFARDGQSFILGARNAASSVSTLVKQGAGPALSLEVGSGAPLKVNSTTRVAKLNADRVDSMEASELAPPRGYARVGINGDIDVAHSKGVIGVEKPDVGGDNNSINDNLYCFELAFAPHAAVGSPHITNGAAIATALQPNSAVDSSCDPPHNDAAVRTLGFGGPEPINFQIVFI
jgi:hypothetical protein